MKNNVRRWGSIHTVMIVGCGRLGSAFAEALAAAGLQVVPVSARRRHSAAQLADQLGLTTSYASIVEAGEQGCAADLLLLTVPDDAIREVAVEVCRAGLPQPGTLVAHPSGSQSSEAIASCRRLGAITASLHPLQTFPRGVGDGGRFQGITFAFEGESEALPPLRELAFRLGADVFEVPEDRKAEYHTAAVLACNCLVGLLHVATQLFAQTGSLPGESLRRLRPLIDATLDNIQDLGPVGALTGPVARGDVHTVERQAKVVAEHLPEQLPLYRELSRTLVELARVRGDAPPQALEQIQEVLRLLEKTPHE